MSRQQPQSVTRATWALLALVLVGAVTAVLTVVLRDDLVDSWAGNNTARADGLTTDTIAPPSFAPVAVVLFLVVVGLAWVLMVFLRAGYGWAQILMLVLGVGVVIATLAGLRTSPPVVFVVLSLVSLVLDAVLLVLLAHPDTRAYVRGTWEPDGA